MIVAENRGFRREIIWDFFSLIWDFFARPRAIALGSKPPLVTRIARTGLGTRLQICIFPTSMITEDPFDKILKRGLNSIISFK